MKIFYKGVINIKSNGKKEKIILKEREIIDKQYHHEKQYIKKGMLKKKIANSQMFSFVKKIENGVVYLKNENVARFYKITPIDLSLTNKDEQELFFYTLAQVYKIKAIIKAYKFDEKINLNLNKLNYDNLIKVAKKECQKEVLENNKSFIDYIEKEKITFSSSYFFAIICKNENELTNVSIEFEKLCFNTVPRLYINQIDNQKELYKILARIYFSDTTPNTLMYYDLIDLVTPIHLQEQVSLLKVDEKRIQLICIKSYPPFIEPYFLNEIVNLPNVNVSFTIKETLEKEKIINRLNANYKSLQADYNSTKNVSDIQTLKTTLDNYQILIEQLANNDEKMKELTIILAISGTKKEREDLVKTIRTIASTKSIKIDIPRLRQMELWQIYDLSPLGSSEYAMYTPTLSLASGFPFTKSYHNDSNGYLIGEDVNYQLPIFWDFFYNDKEQRTSYNVSIVGSTGSGKSFLLKKIIVNELLRNSKVFIFDIENEFKKLTERYQGNYINLANKILINPLQIRFFMDDEDEQASILNRHLGFLESFYSSVFEEITEKEKVILIELTEKLYICRGFANNTTLSEYQKFTNEDYPIFSDLYIFISEYKKTIKSKEELGILTNIEILLRRFIVGQDTIFNSHTTLDLNNQLTTFNLKSLFSTDNKRLANAQILNLLTFLNTEVIGKNGNDSLKMKQPIVIVADEFHHFINDNNNTIIKYFDEMARRLRKYNSSLIIATQSPQDLVATTLKTQNATAIFNNCQYQIIGMLKSNDLNAIDKIYTTEPLTETQKSFLCKAKLGEFLFNITNKKRLRVAVFATPLERFYMGDEEEMKYDENSEI